MNRSTYIYVGIALSISSGVALAGGPSAGSIAGSQSASGVIIEGSNYAAPEFKRLAPQVYAPSMMTTNKCALGLSAAISVPGGGAAFGTMRVDLDCVRVMNAEFAYKSNMQPTAYELMCADESYYTANHRAVLSQQMKLGWICYPNAEFNKKIAAKAAQNDSKTEKAAISSTSFRFRGDSNAFKWQDGS